MPRGERGRDGKFKEREFGEGLSETLGFLRAFEEDALSPCSVGLFRAVGKQH